MPVITGVRSATDEAARSVVILSLHTQSEPDVGATQAQVSIYSKHRDETLFIKPLLRLNVQITSLRRGPFHPRS